MKNLKGHFFGGIFFPPFCKLKVVFGLGVSVDRDTSSSKEPLRFHSGKKRNVHNDHGLPYILLECNTWGDDNGGGDSDHS